MEENNIAIKGFDKFALVLVSVLVLSVIVGLLFQ